MEGAVDMMGHGEERDGLGGERTAISRRRSLRPRTAHEPFIIVTHTLDNP